MPIPIFMGSGGGIGLWGFLVMIVLLGGMMGIIVTLGMEMFVCNYCELPPSMFELTFIIGWA